jgi:hypothetical protein
MNAAKSRWTLILRLFLAYFSRITAVLQQFGHSGFQECLPAGRLL